MHDKVTDDVAKRARDEQGEKILIIENPAVAHLSFAGALESDGFIVRTSRETAEAKHLISEWTPAVILLQLDGVDRQSKQLLREIRRVPTQYRPSIIVIPETKNKDDLISTLKDGADDFILQPVSPTELSARVREQLRLSGFYSRFQADRESLRSLLDITNAITTSLNPTEVFQTIVHRVAEATGAERCSIVLVTRNEGYVLASHDDPGLKDRKIDLKKYPEIIEAINRKDPLIVDDIATNPLMNEVKDSVRGLEGKSLLLVPIVFNDRVLGTLFLRTKKESGGFESDEVNFCRIVANSAFHAIKNARIFQKLTEENSYLQEAAIRDHLTGLYNHNHFYLHLDEDFMRASRYRTPLSLIMMDIDHFKSINDTHGHRIGDMVLKELARLVKQAVRKSDVLARYGGEEFAMILPNTDLKGATDEAERLRKLVEDYRFRAFPAIEVTMSLGVAAYPHKKIASSGDLVSRADAALYRAKNSGRNQVVVDRED